MGVAAVFCSAVNDGTIASSSGNASVAPMPRRTVRRGIAADPVDPNRVVISERWESMDHLQRHLDGLSALSADPDREPLPQPLGAEIVVYDEGTSVLVVARRILGFSSDDGVEVRHLPMPPIPSGLVSG